MFGYVVINREKMSDREYDLYHSFYCGLCRELADKYGNTMSMTLNNDMTFMSILLSGLEEPENTDGELRCPVHLTRHVQYRRNMYTAYGAEMTILLSYYKTLDDVNDEGKGRRTLKKLEKPMHEVRLKYPEKIAVIENALRRITVLEKEGSRDLDLLCNTFGEVLGTIFAVKESIFAKNLYDMGYSLGRFIYLMDAYDDLEEDLKKNQFNPLTNIYQREDFDAYIESILELYMSAAADAFERMPVLLYAEVIRNIIYSGVWSRFEQIRQKRKEEKQ